MRKKYEIFACEKFVLALVSTIRMADEYGSFGKGSLFCPLLILGLHPKGLKDAYADYCTRLLCGKPKAIRWLYPVFLIRPKNR